MLNKKTFKQGLLAGLLFAACFAPVSAQSSTSFQIEESAFNAGGHPNGGTMMTSATYRITLDSLGEAIDGATVASASYSMQGGMVTAYAAPGEVDNLLFTGKDALDWGAHTSADVYHLYRQQSGLLPSAYAGACEEPDIPQSATSASGAPPSGAVWFYIVTAENRLGEEGTRGFESTGSERPEAGACP